MAPNLTADQHALIQGMLSDESLNLIPLQHEVYQKDRRQYKSAMAPLLHPTMVADSRDA